MTHKNKYIQNFYVQGEINEQLRSRWDEQFHSILDYSAPYWESVDG